MSNEEASPSKNYPPTPSSNDEAITTSSESEVFETWTLVTDKKKTKEKSPKPATAIKTTENENNRVEDLDKLDEVSEKGEVKHKVVEEEHQKIPKPEHDSSTDDLSDGISVISESESAGRISPNPYLREQLSNLNLKFATGVDFGTVRPQLTPPNSPLLPTVVTFENQLRQRSSRNDSNTEEIGNKNAVEPLKGDIMTIIQNHPIVRRGLTVMFYVGVALALLAFVGKLRNPEWPPLQSDKSIAQLQQKFTDLELQNNLMRAEIDLLTKQVNYLSNVNDKTGNGRDGQHQHYKRNGAGQMENKSKNFRVWQENDGKVENVENSEDDLKRPYKCRDGKFVETPDNCVETQASGESSMKQNGDTMNDLKSFKNSAERLDGLKRKSVFVEKRETEQFPNVDTQKANNNNPENDNFNGNSQEWRRKQMEGRDDYRKNENFSEKQRKSVDNSRERDSRESNEKHNKSQFHKRRGSHEAYDDHDDDDDSDERFGKRSFKHDKSKINDNNHKYNKQRRYKGSSGERHNKDDSDWHDKLMHHRENARRQNEHQFNEKNWYIKRGDSRERIRVGEMGFR
ncbi:uncharacterized protein LOC119666287 [Teleopsis dalmanni]|uniref:uncharacterized protein LOC119666287 n=1 Tax=Teleopsis dalmanni TaxID=139649 RepID=UPI0018CE4103|nr:uncharacterized protein LOC119666287 [Teleopsis dalmanni]